MGYQTIKTADGKRETEVSTTAYAAKVERSGSIVDTPTHDQEQEEKCSKAGSVHQTHTFSRMASGPRRQKKFSPSKITAADVAGMALSVSQKSKARPIAQNKVKLEQKFGGAKIGTTGRTCTITPRLIALVLCMIVLVIIAGCLMGSYLGGLS